MLDNIMSLLTPQIVVTLLAAVAAFATALTVLMPVLARDRLATRMQVMATERDKMRASSGRSCQERGPGPPAHCAQGLHAGHRRTLQPQEHVRDRGSAG
jgi:hypothetical protein